MNEIIHTLAKPVQFEEKTYETLVLDFDSLTGRDIKEAKKRFDNLGVRITPVLAMDTEFAAYVAARAAKVPVEVFDYITASDYVAVTQMVINFFMNSGLFKNEIEAREMLKAKESADMKLIDTYGN